jgi:CheY-like chemotaxis protein
MLQLCGHQVVTAYDGLAAFNAIRTHHPHIAVLDLGMPVMDGLRLARRVREQPWGRDVTLVAVTGWGQPADRQRALEAGFDHHLTKPSDLQQLQALVAESGRAPTLDEPTTSG